MHLCRTFYEKFLATASFTAAVGFGAASMAITHDHDVAAGALMAMAQFLLLTASVLHIDYKLNIYGHTFGTKKTEEIPASTQQPAMS